MTAATAESLTSLAARLAKPEDRETYAGLISYFHSLPDHDELFHIAELLGLLALLGHRVPDALAEAMTELRELAVSADNYRDQVEARLAGLPAEITAGVNIAAMAKTAGELFRQEVANTGLQSAATLLRASSSEIATLSAEIFSTLTPASQQYKTISTTISTELGKLALASTQLQHHNARLTQQERTNAWMWQIMAVLVLFLLGVLGGMLIEKARTADGLAHIESKIDQIRNPVAAVAPLAKKAKRSEQ